MAYNPKHDGYQHGPASMAHNFFDKKTFNRDIKNENMSDQRLSDLATRQLAQELHKSIIIKYNKRKVQSPFIDNISGANIGNMQLISKFNKIFRFLLFLIDIYSKYAWVIPLKDKEDATITNDFQKILKISNRKPNKIWVDKSSEFYNRSMKSWLKKML